MAASVAHADLQVCNKTKGRIGVSIGYKDGDGWSTEGWWNVTAGQCETILRGTLQARFYYLYAMDYDQGGEWGGRAFMCTRDKEFTIRGIEDCLARGYDRTGFFEVDTADQRLWVIQLTDQNSTTPNAPPVAGSNAPGSPAPAGGPPGKGGGGPAGGGGNPAARGGPAGGGSGPTAGGGPAAGGGNPATPQ